MLGKRSRSSSGSRGVLAMRVPAWRKRSLRKRSRPSAVYKGTRKLSANTTYRYSRYSYGGSTYDCTGTSSASGMEFALSSVRGYSDFTSLYDSFMITGVQVTFQLITNPDSINSTNGAPSTFTVQPSNWYPKLWYVFDNDDSNSVSLDNIRERQGVKVKILRPNSQIKVFVKPSVAVQTYLTSTSTGYAPKRMFLDMATGQSVPHYGLKFCIDALGIDPNDTYPFKVRVETKYYLKFKGVL